MSRHVTRFADRLITALLEAISEVSVIDPERDGDKEALSIWLVHFLKKPSQTLGARRHLEMVLERCCLYPGYWSQRIGKEVLKIGDEDLRSDWEDLLDASTIGQSEEIVVSAATEGTVASLPHDLDGIGPMMAATEFRGWSRAVLCPITPLGVVR